MFSGVQQIIELLRIFEPSREDWKKSVDDSTGSQIPEPPLCADKSINEISAWLTLLPNNTGRDVLSRADLRREKRLSTMATPLEHDWFCSC